MNQHNHKGNDNHHGNENTGNFVRNLGNRRLGRGGIVYHADNLSKRGILSDLSRLGQKHAGLVDGCGINGIARGFLHGNAFSGKRRFVHGTSAFNNHTVGRNLLSGTDTEKFSDNQRGSGNFHLFASAKNMGRIGRHLH